jgi:hypothetical protein
MLLDINVTRYKCYQIYMLPDINVFISSYDHSFKEITVTGVMYDFHVYRSVYVRFIPNQV